MPEPLNGLCLWKMGKAQAYSGTVDGIIDPSKLLDCLFDHGVHFIFARDIDGQCNSSIGRVSTKSLAFARCLLSAINVDVGKDYASNARSCVCEGTITAYSTTCESIQVSMTETMARILDDGLAPVTTAIPSRVVAMMKNKLCA